MPQQEELARLMGRDAYAELAGLEVLHADIDYVEVRLPVTPKILNGHGNVHGGAMFTLADYAAASVSNLRGNPTVAVNGSISFIRAVRSGHILAKARLVKAGQRVNFMTVELFDSAGELAAIFQGSSIQVTKKTSFWKTDAERAAEMA